jgi:FMN-dependent NADH-azoreductase
MAHLLHLDTSISGASSVSRAIGRAFSDQWMSTGNTIVYRDLAAAPLPYLSDSALHWAPELRPPGSNPPAGEEQLQREVIAELLTADVVLIAAPMYNYSLPATLKTWIDYVHVAGTTFSGVQPFAGRAVVVINSRGGSYDAGTSKESWDHGVPVLDIVLGDALGMTLEVITANLTLPQKTDDLTDRANGELAAALSKAKELAKKLG